MIKERIKNLFTKNLGTKFLSLFIALLLWVYVIGVINPKVDLEFKNIDVSLQGSENIKNQYGLIVTDITDPKISIRVQGERNKLLTLGSSEILAYVDLSTITTKGTFKLPVIVEIPQGKGIVSERSLMATNVTVDKAAKAEVPVKAVVSGNVVDGYTMGSPQVTPSQITISGPESVVIRVSYATCTVTKEAISEDIKTDVGFILYDEKDEQVVSDWLTITPEKANIYVPVLGYKTVPVTVNLVDPTGTDNLKNDAQVVISPSVLKITGTPTEVEKISSVEAGSINLSTVSGSATYKFPVLLPTGVSEVDGVTEISVTVTLKSAQIRALRADKISVLNIAEGQKVLVGTQFLDIAYIGSEDSAGNVKVILDLKEEKYTPGTYTLPVSVEMSEGNTPIGNYYITIEIK